MAGQVLHVLGEQVCDHQDTGAVETSAAALRQAIADADWDTVERHGGLDAVVEKIDHADEETAALKPPWRSTVSCPLNP